MPPEQTGLSRTRMLIDRVDEALLLLLAVRRQLALGARHYKQSARLPLADASRERQVHLRGQRIARHLGIPAGTAQALAELAIADARQSQGLATDPAASDLNQGGGPPRRAMITATMESHYADHSPRAPRWLRLLPPPSRWAVALRACPPALQRRLLERAMARVLATPLEAGALAFLQGRCLGIEVTDLGLRWVVTLERGRLSTVEEAAEASVRGTATDLLLLAGRLEDADTLFFQRRLVLTGDTELGLTARNLLERLPWEQVPLALRIVLNRGARLAQAARSAWRDAQERAQA